MFTIKFGIAPEYVITTEEGERVIHVPLEALDADFKYYSPSNHPNIYTQLAAVRDEKTLLKFARRYGLLGIGDRKSIPVHLAGIASVSYKSATRDNVADFLDVAHTIRKLLGYWTKLLDTGEAIKRDLTWSFFEELWPEYAEILQNASDAELTRAYLAVRIARHLGGVRPAVNFTGEGRVAPGFAFLTLYDVVWFQFYQDLIGYSKFKQCPHCGAWHTGRGKFCPAPPLYSRSPCENAYAQKRHRNKLKKKEGLTNGR